MTCQTSAASTEGASGFDERSRLNRGLPLGAERGVPEGDPLRAGPALGGTTVVPEPILDGRRQRRQGKRGVGRDRQVYGDQRLVGLRPAPGRVVFERDRDYTGALVEQAYLARASIGVAEGTQEVRDIEGEDEVGLAHDLVSRPAHVERMTARDAWSPLVLDGQIDQRGREELGETAQGRCHARPAPKVFHHDQRVARVGEAAGGVVNSARVGVRWRGRLEARDVRQRNRTLERFLLQRGVETQVDRPLGLRTGEPPRAQKCLGNGSDACRLVVQLDVVPDLVPCTRAVWIQSIQGRRFVVSMGPVPPSTRIGTRSQKALKMAMLACWRPTNIVDDGRHGRPFALA